MQQDAKRPAPRVPSRGWRFFCPEEPSSIQQVFIALGHVFLQGWGRRAKLSAGPPATAPYLNKLKIAVEAKDPTHSPRVGIEPPQYER
eukprot:11546430-Ditylum_brightwellii.AAC.1